MSLIEEQLKIEQESIDFGIDHYRKQVAEAKQMSREGTTLHGILLMKHSVDRVSQVIRDFLDSALSGKIGRYQTSALRLDEIDPEVSAYIALKCMVDGVSNRMSLTKSSLMIGNALEDHVKFSIWQSKERKIFNRTLKDVKARTSNRHYQRYNVIRKMSKIEVLDYALWDKSERVRVGSKLIDLVIGATGLFKVKTFQLSKRLRETVILATEDTLKWIEEVNKRGEVLHPRYYPCVIPPLDWSGPLDGGYHTDKLRQIPMIKTTNRKYLQEMETVSMPMEYRCINALQRTQWCVNVKVLEVMKQVWESGQPWPGIPPKFDHPIPPAPVPEGMNKQDMDQELYQEFITWKKNAANIYNENARIGSKRIQFVRTLSMAQKFEKYRDIYFVYQSDFRGRKYTVSSFMTPQGPDFAKALLTFSASEPIENDEQAKWLAVHGANCYGYDKVSLDDRYQWCLDNLDKIQRTAEDPFGYRWWTEADEPWQFLAFCFEWSGFADKGYGYMSSLPVMVDGSNNGLQHYSAILRDPVGGKATNLTNEEMPQDIYQEVADLVLKDVQSEYDVDTHAKRWIDSGLITRKLTKRPVMVVPYGGTMYSCRAYIEDAMREEFLKGVPNPFGDDLFKSSMYLARSVWKAIGQVVVSAREAMKWLQVIGNGISKKQMPIVWSTPSGFVVHQMYPAIKERQIATHIDGKLIKPVIATQDYARVDRHRAVNGIAPNFVHALDACALTITVNKCLDDGIMDFAMVHDSYGVFAHHSPELAVNLRQAFYEMYNENDVLHQFRLSATDVLDEVESPPERGNLDLSKVLKSDYFFS
jgi:DNA-directed RNA polymerase